MAKLPHSSLIWLTAGSGVVVQIAAAALNAIFAFALKDNKPGLQVLIFVDFAINCLSIFPLAYLITYYLPRLKNGTLNLKTAFCRRYLGMSLFTLVIAVGLSLATLIWASLRIEELPDRVAGQSSKILLIVWFCVWGLATLLQIATFVLFARGTVRGRRTTSPESLDLDFGMRTPPEMKEQTPAAPRPTSESFRSQDPTLASPPQTPSTIGLPNPFKLAHSNGKGTATSSRTKLVHSNSFTQDSAKSSFDIPSRDTASIDHPFDSWDTSGLARDIRNTMHSSPVVPKSGLETIPGSRPESPAKALDGPFLPSTPALDSSPPTKLGDYGRSFSSPKVPSSPPSSPPNFSRPTSRVAPHPILSNPVNRGGVGASMESLIHPLLRSTSPNSGPVPRLGSMVAASPMAGQSISAKAVKRMRSASMPQQPSALRSAEIMHSHKESNGTSGVGSPGPSVIDDEELPTVIPGFVLSAGSRDSILGYDRRKSLKERPASFHSQGDRLSMLLP